MRPLAIYIHVPFCVKKCAYCDFASWPVAQCDTEKYLRALPDEMRGYEGEKIETVFIGGGTPSVLSAQTLTRLMRSVTDTFRVAKDAEWTVECNPGTVTTEKLRVLAENGVNRVSFGAQASQPHLLTMLGRIHTWDETLEAVVMAREAGIQNINLDLMYALPAQTLPEWRDTVRKAADTGIPHISCYSLILEEGTPLTKQIESGILAPCNEEDTLLMQHAAQDILAEYGLSRYEISNYAKDGFESRHNLAYWLRKDYIGLGCAAHSFYHGTRFHNAETLAEYLAGGIGLDREELTEQDAFEETVLLGTRTKFGIDLKEISDTYGKDLFPRAKTLAKEGLVTLDGNSMVLTQRGMDVHNTVVLYLVQ